MFGARYATLCIRENPGCMFIATNCDAVTHLTDAQEWAGNSSSVIWIFILFVQYFYHRNIVETVLSYNKTSSGGSMILQRLANIIDSNHVFA